MTDDEYKAKFAKNLKELRKKARVTQKELGIACGYENEVTAWRTVQKWESMIQYPTFPKLRVICTTLNCTLEELIP